MIEYILKTVFCIFNKEDVRLIIYYGNKQQGKDIDIFIVIAGESEYNCIHQNNFDITYVGGKWLKEMIEHLDPLLTEPVLTGEVVHGNVNKIKKAINEIRSSGGVTDYLINKALLYFQWANAHFQNGDLIYTCDCIRFSLGFYCFAIHYKKGGTIVTFFDLINEFENKLLMIEKATKIAKNKTNLTYKNVEYLLTETSKILTKG